MKLKSLLFTLLFLIVGSTVAKANNLPIPVTVNESITVTLFFPSEITKVIEPAVNYKFDYDLNGTMGTLMARKGVASNLTVITKDGSIFSFLLRYDQEVDNFTYMLSADQAIGTIEPSGTTTPKKSVQVAPENKAVNKYQSKRVNSVKNKKVINATSSLTESVVMHSSIDDKVGSEDVTVGGSLYDVDREGYYDIFCENNYEQEFDLSKSIKAGAGIELKLNALTTDKNEFYFIFQVTNRLTSLFHAEKLQFYVRTSLGDEPVKMIPLYVFNHQEYIEAGRTKKMVYVFKEFKLSADQKVYITLDELDGMRSTVLKIDSQMINSVGDQLVFAD